MGVIGDLLATLHVRIYVSPALARSVQSGRRFISDGRYNTILVQYNDRTICLLVPARANSDERWRGSEGESGKWRRCESAAVKKHASGRTVVLDD
jgi:hypothetical protein